MVLPLAAWEKKREQGRGSGGGGGGRGGDEGGEMGSRIDGWKEYSECRIGYSEYEDEYA